MGRLELPRPLQALEPKCILGARRGTKSLHHNRVPQKRAQRSSSEDRVNPADNLRTILSTGTSVAGLVEFAIVIAELLLAFSGHVLGGVLIAILGGGMLAPSTAKWEGWIFRGLGNGNAYLSIHHLTVTLLGIDRRLCIVILIAAFLVFRHFTFLSVLIVFALLWSGAYWVARHDAELVVVVPKAFRQRDVYALAKQQTSAKASFQLILRGQPTRKEACSS